MALGQRLGLFFQDTKTVRPCTRLEFLGLELDTIDMEVRLPPDKLIFLMDMLDEWARKRSCSLLELQGLIGFLQFAAQVIPPSRAFIRRLIEFSMTFASGWSRRHIPSYARSDLCWWTTFCSAWNGTLLITPPSRVVHVYTDASGTKGLGGIFEDQWFSSRVPRRFRGSRRDIQFKEIYAVLHAVLRWGHLWRHCHVVFHIDNSAIDNAIVTERNRPRPSMAVLRTLLMLAACLEFSFSSSWLSSADNALADAASCFQYTRLFQLAPYLNRKPSTINHQTSGLKRTLNSLDESRSTSGTVSHPALGKRTRPGNVRSSTLSGCIPAVSTVTAPTFQPHRLPSWNGLHILANGAYSPKPLSPTSAVFVPSMSTLTSVSLPASPPQCSVSSGGLSAITANAIGIQNSPSPLTSSAVFAPSSIPPHARRMPILPPQ